MGFSVGVTFVPAELVVRAECLYDELVMSRIVTRKAIFDVRVK